MQNRYSIIKAQYITQSMNTTQAVKELQEELNIGWSVAMDIILTWLLEWAKGELTFDFH